MLERLAKWWLMRNARSHTRTYCPGCGVDLVSSDAFEADNTYVHYGCIRCHTRSFWLFDAPVPILLGVA